ncbi:MAG: hypothetical protein DI564_14795 [Rhodanobacter denitrificans]|uniref:DUF11 domain-containing protein n=1 Tax=Rhodanobacter denitrificans TaxID=666685 RepID=A0A2W5K2Z6_9GAMM|nr:MAG: hypothetical protein DI564_14795 [Rhodanobacter denitrificans]
MANRPERAADDEAATAPAPSATVWQQRRTYGSVVYVLDNASLSIRRYDLAVAQWLPRIDLERPASAFAVDASGVYTRVEKAVYRYALDGTALGPLPNVTVTRDLLELVGDYVVVSSDQGIHTYHKSTGTPAAFLYTSTPLTGAVSLPDQGSVYAVNTSWSPTDIYRMKVDPVTGAVSNFIDSPYHGAFPTGSRVYAREQGGWLFDSSGTVYWGDSLQRRGSLGGAVQGAVFFSDRFLVMRGARLAVFSNDLKETGLIQAPSGMLDIVGYADRAYAITGAIDDLRFVPIDLEAAQPAVPSTARDWVAAAPKATHVLGDGTGLILTSAAEHAAYPFSPQTWSFGRTIPMMTGALDVAYSRVNGRVYASYTGGAIYAYPLATPGRADWFSATAYTANGLSTAGEYVFASDLSGAWASHYTFSPEGDGISWREWNYISSQYEWDPVTRRIFFLREGVSPNDLMFESIALDGSITDGGDSPYHGDFQPDYPIRVSPDAALIGLGSGVILDSVRLEIIHQLDHGWADFAWLGNDLYGLTASGQRINRYSASFDVVSTGRVRGTPRRLIPAGEGFVYVADVGTSTIIGRFDAFMSKADLAVDPSAPGSVFDGGSAVTVRVTVGNNGVVAASGATVSIDPGHLQGAVWRCVAAVRATPCPATSLPGASSTVVDIEDGGQLTYEVSGQVPPGSFDRVTIAATITPAVPASDPELRNNAQSIRLRLDRLFVDAFE